MATQITGCILTPDGWIGGTLDFAERISAIDGTRIPAPGAGEALVLPGFIDLHVHGGGGADVMGGNGAVDTVARIHARPGTTSNPPASITPPTPSGAVRSILRPATRP